MTSICISVHPTHSLNTIKGVTFVADGQNVEIYGTVLKKAPDLLSIYN